LPQGKLDLPEVPEPHETHRFKMHGGCSHPLEPDGHEDVLERGR
jgi:hypothetical protein